MRWDELNRRDFHRLSAAALGGLIAGTAVGCGEAESKPGAKAGGDASTVKDSSARPSRPGDAKGAVAATTVALHACRGLNECKEEGRDHKNACAGQGTCYTAKHECSGQNDCKYQGGCGDTMGLNDCKGKGGCGHFPISDAAAWKKAREAFEQRMKTAGKTAGAAPAAAKS